MTTISNRIPRKNGGKIKRVRQPTTQLWHVAAISLSIAFAISALISILAGSFPALTVTLAFAPPLMICVYLSLSKETEIFHPFMFLALTVFFGVTVQTIFLHYLDDGSHKFAIGVRTDADTIFTAVSAITIGVLFLIFGYSIGNRKLKTKIHNVAWSLKRVYIASILLLLVGVFALGYYIAVFDVMENFRNQFSVKRRFIDEDTGISRTLGYVRLLINFSQLAFFISYAAYLKSKHKPKQLKLLIIISAVAGIFMPFIASSRLGVLTFILTSIMIHHFSTGGWSSKRLKSVGVVVTIIIIIMGGLRFAQTRGLSFDHYIDEVSIVDMVEPVIASSNLLAVGKTATTMESVPSLINYQYGKTYLLWMVAPIPRSLWPDKPIIRIGAILGEAIFGTTLRGGVPPGAVGELYLNFGWVGIPAGMFVFGMAFARFFNSSGTAAYYNTNKMLIYSVLVLFLTFTGMSADFSGMMSMILQRLIPLLIILKFVTVNRR